MLNETSINFEIFFLFSSQLRWYPYLILIIAPKIYNRKVCIMIINFKYVILFKIFVQHEIWTIRSTLFFQSLYLILMTLLNLKWFLKRSHLRHLWHPRSVKALILLFLRWDDFFNGVYWMSLVILLILILSIFCIQ